MITIAILYILTLVFILAREYFFMQERQKLLDRIQAKDLPEYKAFQQPVIKEENESKQEVEFL